MPQIIFSSSLSRKGDHFTLLLPLLLHSHYYFYLNTYCVTTAKGTLTVQRKFIILTTGYQLFCFLAESILKTNYVSYLTKKSLIFSWKKNLRLLFLEPISFNVSNALAVLLWERTIPFAKQIHLIRLQNRLGWKGPLQVIQFKPLQ